jgi:uncharacterized protein (DUF1330 family)
MPFKPKSRRRWVDRNENEARRREPKMAKAYWIARIDIHNMDGYKDYIAQNGAVFAKYGAKFLVRGGPHEVKEGTSRSRNVVLEFKDYETALACYNSPEYARLVTLRSPHSQGDLVIIEGYDGPQPGA